MLLIRKTHWEAIGLSNFKRTLGGGENGVDISFREDDASSAVPPVGGGIRLREGAGRTGMRWAILVANL